MNDDIRWMDYALRLGRQALGTTAENPPVGCVIVKEGRVLGVGCTAPGGRPHAETEALAMAGKDARGATAYATLEPCAHQGRTPPCAEALVAAGVARVVTAIEDPDPRTSGAGHKLLRDARIAVETGLGAGEARKDLAGFLKRITRKRPYVILKLAVSADNMIAARPGERTRITGEEVRRRAHLLRAQCDAIVVGMKTVAVDDPRLNVRLPGLERRSPKPFVIGFGPLPGSSYLASVRAEQLEVGEISSQNALQNFHGFATAAEDLIEGWLEELAERGFNRLLVEGGAKTALRFLKIGAVDEFQLFRSPRELGSDGVPMLAGLSLEDAMRPFTMMRAESLGIDQLNVYERLH